MKKNIFCIVLAGIIATIFSGCKKDKELSHTKVTPVQALYFPENNKFVKLDGSGTVTFEWQQAKAEDNGYVSYEVAFTKEDGDFTNPIYTVASGRNGFDNTIVMSYADLNRVATLAGIKPAETGKLKWTVISSKGINPNIPSVSSLIEVERPDSFVTPNDLYVTGAATEGGTDLANARHFKNLGNGKFEIYTKLKDGDYQFASDNKGTPSLFSINAAGKLAENGTTAFAGNKVMRIVLDFNTREAQMTEISSVGLWFSPEGKVLFDLPYVGNGTWLATDKPIVFRQESWGRDERYKFRFSVKNAVGEAGIEYFGSKNRDNNRPDASSPASYYDVVAVDNSQFDYAFKFITGADNHNVDIKVDFSGAAYTHSVTVK
ncbi:SusE domain-containing protein [Mucilaginibacter sp. UR6-1]|uniref:SusE domain-containing protein n=1 Tax=Mucilaginibacter sp. UR6-1 TaxID=1435643 RepID=UPI001E4EC078|nr:SusE domain-containing protein [Mucilaginibacter sp. UR6-1]MCC8409299.1 SusE domain-containing protein [Mucilaginibacter sp. UR6-1]